MIFLQYSHFSQLRLLNNAGVDIDFLVLYAIKE